MRLRILCLGIIGYKNNAAKASCILYYQTINLASVKYIYVGDSYAATGHVYVHTYT